MPYRSHRGMGPADPGGHRHSGSPGGSHGARIHPPDLLPETAAAPGPSERSGRGSATLRSQSGGLDRDPAGREGRLPVRTIQWYLRMFHQLKLSVGAIVRAVHQTLPRTRYGVVRQAGPEVDEALERIRCSPVVHADETGWRENGKNGCVWTPGRGRGQAFQHSQGAVLPAPGPGRGGGGRGLGRVLRRDSGERLLRGLPPLPRTQTEVLGPPPIGVGGRLCCGTFTR